jgi:hypothetical protein
MICIFEISSFEAPDFKRLIHLDSGSTFEDLHRTIQNTSNFDQSQLASFFVTNDRGKREIEITPLDPGTSSTKVQSMQKAKLDKYISEIGQKFVYVFDFFNDRFFYIELKEKLMKTDLKEPFVAYEKGNAPSQFLINDLESPGVELMEKDESYKSFGDLEDYYEIFGEMDA